MGVTAVFIDGAYLDQVMNHDHRSQRIDYEGLVSAISGQDELLRAYYYHCLPYQSSSPTEDEKKAVPPPKTRKNATQPNIGLSPPSAISHGLKSD